MARVLLTPQAIRDLHRLPGGMIRRVNDVLERLQNWPRVSGAKPLRGVLKGQWRIRCGDWRIVFHPLGDDVHVTAIDNRRDVYEQE